jgi:hypothetical protein
MSVRRMLMVGVSIGWLWPIGLAAAPDRCKAVKGKLATVRVNENCASPVNFCASGVITGKDLISGTTQATVLGLVPSVGLPGVEPESTLSYAGERTIQTSHGTLTLRFTGVFDTARGEASELERVTAGDGRFKGATGSVWLTATSNADGTVFEGDLTGQVCLAR